MPQTNLNYHMYQSDHDVLITDHKSHSSNLNHMPASVTPCYSSEFDPLCLFLRTAGTSHRVVHTVYDAIFSAFLPSPEPHCATALCVWSWGKPASVRCLLCRLWSKVCKWISISPDFTWQVYWFISGPKPFQMWKCRHTWRITEINVVRERTVFKFLEKVFNLYKPLRIFKLIVLD